jgi:hypothetical protein
MSIGSKVVQAPLDPTGLSATYFVASADPSGFDRIPATLDPSHGGWTTTKVRTPAPVEFTLPDVPAPIPRLFAFPSPQLSVLYSVLEHRNPQPMPMGSTFAVKVTLDAPTVAGQTFQAYVVGAWLKHDFAAEVVLGVMEFAPQAFAFNAATDSASGRPQLDGVTADDAFLILRYVGPTLTGFAVADPFTQTDMLNMVMPPTMTAVAPGVQSPAFHAAVAPGALVDRYKNVKPPVPAPVQVSANWSLVAAPGYTIASGSGPLLQAGALAMTDTGLNLSYINPFADRGWNTMFTLGTSVSRVYMAPLGPMGMALPVNLQAGMNQFLEPPQPPPTDPVSLDLPAGLPQAITLDSTVLTLDGVNLKPPNRFVNVSFTVDAPASAAGQSPTLYNLQLIDLVFNSKTMAVDRVLVFAAAGKDPAFALRPELFQVDHSYTLRAFATLGGYPTIDQGNFVNRQLPLAQSYLDSGVFKVTP